MSMVYAQAEKLFGFFNVRHAKDTVHKAFLLVLKIEIFVIIYHHHHHLFRS